MYYIGVDLGGTNIAAGIVDSEYNIIKKDSVPTGANRDGKEIVKDMAALCEKLLADTGIAKSEIEYVGIATPGTANSATGIVEYANNLPFLNFPIADLLKEYLGVNRVLIENDANAAAKAEDIAGVAKDANVSVMITLGTGLGGGIVINGHVYSGFNFAGAELGHIVIEYNGRQCTCGRKGCWETYSSATGLVNLTKDKIRACREQGRETVMEKMIEGNIDRVSGRTAFSAMKQYGDAAAAEVVDEYISYLACGIVNVIDIFRPDIISIGGGICNEGDYLLKPLIAKVEAMTKGEPEKNPKIMIAKLGNDAGIIGAAVLGM